MIHPIVLILALASAAGHAQTPMHRLSTDDVHLLLVAAINAMDGRSYGQLTGESARLVTEQFRASGPILVDVTTERRYRQEGCSRLKLVFTQEGVLLPGASRPQRRSVDIGLNYCLDGMPPKSLS